MSPYRFLSFIWILPAYLLFLTIQQGMVHVGSKTTVEEGDSYAAQVLDMDVKQIAAQSNGYIVLEFTTNEGEVINRKFTLSIQMAQKVMESSVVPLYYRPGGFPEMVLLPTYEIQRKTSFFNLSVALVGFIVMVIASSMLQRYSNRMSAGGSDDITYERVDQ